MHKLFIFELLNIYVMKKLILISAVFVIALTGCRSDDDNTPPASTNAVVGVWNPAEYRIYSGSNNTLINTIPADACNKQSVFDFKSNGMVTTTFYELNMAGVCNVTAPETLPYLYNTQTQTLTVDGEVMRVKTLTSDIFELELIDYQDDDNNDGVQDVMYLILAK